LSLKALVLEMNKQAPSSLEIKKEGE